MRIEKIDVANLLGIKAGQHLSDAYKICIDAYAYQKEKLHDAKTIKSHLLLMRRYEAEACIEAVILFQASMESIINEELYSQKALIEVRNENEGLLRKLKSLSFKNKWAKSFAALNLEEYKEYILNYFDFYGDYRVSITHPKSRFMDIEKFRFPNVYEGIRNGWIAYEKLIEKLEKSPEIGSWEAFCERCSLPTTINPKEYPDYI